MKAPSNLAPTPLPILQVDGGQHAANVHQLTMTITHGDRSFVLGRLLITAQASAEGTAPLLDQTPMQLGTEYWLIELDRWAELQELYSDRSQRDELALSLSKSERMHPANVKPNETVFIASEQATWAPADATEWPPGVVGFGLDGSGVFRGLGFDQRVDPSSAKVYWAQQHEDNLTVAQIADRTLLARYTPTEVKYFASSDLASPPK